MVTSFQTIRFKIRAFVAQQESGHRLPTVWVFDLFCLTDKMEVKSTFRDQIKGSSVQEDELQNIE